jgi:hypothetical protein
VADSRVHGREYVHAGEHDYCGCRQSEAAVGGTLIETDDYLVLKGNGSFPARQRQVTPTRRRRLARNVAEKAD